MLRGILSNSFYSNSLRLSIGQIARNGTAVANTLASRERPLNAGHEDIRFCELAGTRVKECLGLSGRRAIAVHVAAFFGRELQGLWIMNGKDREKSKDNVLTASRLRMWWLIRVYGYRVVGQKLVPTVTFCGSVQMIPHWILSAPAVQQDLS